jgi:protein arginine N-methyltransferase 1
MYGILQYGHMMQDEIRVNSHYQALKQLVRPESIVVDLGSGIGIFALMACQLGAKRVYAIESNLWGSLGKQMAAANGFADRIEFIAKSSNEVALPQQGDILIGDLRGTSPLTIPNMRAFIDARQRFLKPGGMIVPQRDVVYVSLVSLPKIYKEMVNQPWLDNPYGLNLEPGFKFVVNSVHSINRPDIPPPLFPYKVWADIDYAKLENPNFSATFEWEATDSATAHAVFTWFRAYLTDDVSYTNAPWEVHAPAYGNLLFFFQNPLEIVAGDALTLELKASPVQQDYVYFWNTTLRSKNGEIKAKFQQSSFYATPPTLAAFRLAGKL